MYKNKIILGTANLSNGYGLENKKFKNHNDLKKIFKYIKRNNKKVTTLSKKTNFIYRSN